MRRHRTRLNDIRVFPHYRDVPIEVEPVAKNGTGQYVSGQFLNQTYHSLALDNAVLVGELHIGATYNCVAVDEDGISLKTHWLYCTSLDPFPSFGIVQDWTQTGGFAPLLSKIDTPFVKLEELADIVTIFPSLPPVERHTQAQVGHRGWLVMTRMASPYAMGILVDDPSLPPSLSVGSQDITMTASCVRTHQSIGFDALTCVSAGGEALFLQRQSL